MRGSHPGSFEVAHALAWQGQKPEEYAPLDEHYDLIVVGGGMSGLAAAWYYLREKGQDARILILDNHDDFGGHAKRNEFHYKGRMLLSLGGAQNLDSPSNYGDVAGSLLIDIGIDEQAITQMALNTPDNYVLGGKLNGEVGLTVPDGDNYTTIGGNWMKFWHGRGDYRSAVNQLPIPEDQKNKLIRFFGGEQDFLDDLSVFVRQMGLRQQYELQPVLVRTHRTIELDYPNTGCTPARIERSFRLEPYGTRSCYVR